jgi:hypothetical protein
MAPKILVSVELFLVRKKERLELTERLRQRAQPGTSQRTGKSAQGQMCDDVDEEDP